MKNIFLADDDSDDVSFFRDTLEDIDPVIHLTVATNGLHALELLQSSQVPDVIFLDLNMPQVDGLECLEDIRGREQLREIPVIMLSTGSQPRDVQRALAMGAVGFITKPTSLSELRKILSRILGTPVAGLSSVLHDLKGVTSALIFT